MGWWYRGAGSLRNVTASQIRAVVDVAELEPGTRKHRVPVHAGVEGLSPDQLLRIRVKSVAPAEVSVRISGKRPS